MSDKSLGGMLIFVFSFRGAPLEFTPNRISCMVRIGGAKPISDLRLQLVIVDDDDDGVDRGRPEIGVEVRCAEAPPTT